MKPINSSLKESLSLALQRKMEPNTPTITKRLWRIVRIVFFMMRKGISKSKLMLDLHLMLKRGKLAGKAIGNLMFHHHHHHHHNSAVDAHLTFVAPKEYYEFSCSNSPAYPSIFPFHISGKRNRKTNRHNYYFSPMRPSSAADDDITTAAAVQKILEMLNNETAVAASPAMSGFGRSPMVRQLRITDSPFPLRNDEDDSHVDEQAEQFIERFYEQLKQQARLTALEGHC